jgi:hypothetical protein
VYTTSPNAQNSGSPATTFQVRPSQPVEGGVDAQGVAIVSAHLLRSVLGDDRVLSDADVALLATTASTSLRPAA